MKGTDGGRDGGSKGDGWIMSDHKRVGLHRAFSPSGLSAAPGSNIHLAWCIPGLETLMWFVGESRWQVHGSTLLTDSAGASGRVHNNTECLSPPSFPLLSKHTSYPQPYHQHTHTHTFSFFWYQCVGTGRLQKEPFGMLTFSSALSVLQSLVFHSLLLSMFLSLLFPCPSLSLPLTPSLYTSLLSYFITLTPTPATLMHMPLDSSPIILWLSFTPSITLLIPVSSPLLLSSTFSHRARTQVLEIWCLVLPLQCRNDVMQ